MALLPRHRVCFYTDGLIERRGRSLTVGLERLRQAMFAGPAEAVCAAVMRPGGRRAARDDIALLVLRRQDVAGNGSAGPGAARHAHLAATRAHRDTSLARRCSGHREATADLVAAVGEACANAIEHAYGPKGGDVSVRLTIVNRRTSSP